jgi:hypothetical protein
MADFERGGGGTMAEHPRKIVSVIETALAMADEMAHEILRLEEAVEFWRDRYESYRAEVEG